MLQAAAKWNAVMRQQSPEGFELDEQHTPHVTLVQRFVAANDLEAVLAAVASVKAKFAPNKLVMKTKGFYHIPAGEIGLAGIVVEPSADLLALQRKVIEAVAPFSRAGGDQSAFVPDATGTPFDPMLFKYVDSFVPATWGSNYNPHVTIGIAPIAWLQNFEKQPFADFTFRATGIEVYQLGNFGTASRDFVLGYCCIPKRAAPNVCFGWKADIQMRKSVRALAPIFRPLPHDRESANNNPGDECSHENGRPYPIRGVQALSYPPRANSRDQNDGKGCIDPLEVAPCPKHEPQAHRAILIECPQRVEG